MTTSESAAASAGASPSSSGPAGALFEGQVAAHYLQTMLADADPRGLPGVSIERVELQRAGEGHPLDDVIVRGFTRAGDSAVLEVQVKRTITFSPGDEVFKDVVGQLATAYRTLDLSDQRHQFAVATDRTSFKITGPYQDVLRWAREVSSASIFFGRIKRKKVGNDNMRTFVETVRTHLQAASCAFDDETVWQLLRRFQILVFDYDAPGSQSLELAIERARSLLDPTDVSRASAFWKVLIGTAIRVAAAGGDLDRTQLLTEVGSIDSFRIRGSRRNRAPRETLAEDARLAAAGLNRSIAGVTLTRSVQLVAVQDARDHGRYIEVRGDPGVGKSGILGMIVDQVLTEGRAIVFSPERTIPGGWVGFKATLQIEGNPKEFLSDLASDGGAILFVDSLDFFDDASKRATVSDLVRTAASIPAFHVIVTARTDFDKDEPNWLPADALTKLGRARPVVIGELGDDEVDEFRSAAPNLRALLADDHPARSVARNLFRLARLLEVRGSTDQLRSEVDLIERWWKTADGPNTNRRERARLLADLTDAVLSGGERIETQTTSSAVDALIVSGTLRELGLDQLIFRHDVLRDWGVAARLHDTPDKIDRLPLIRAAAASLARGVELGARFALERSEDGQAWVSYVNRVSPAEAHLSWRRWALLAILRSELAFALLDRGSASLLENDGALLRELIRTALAVESRPLAETLAEHGADVESVPAVIYGPTNGSWARLVRWLLIRRADLPLPAIPDVVELFQSLSMSMFFADPLTPQMAEVLTDWLMEIEDARDHRPLAADLPRFARAFRHHDLERLAGDVRQSFLLMAKRIPERAQGYLRRLLGRWNKDEIIREIMRFRGSLAQAAPAELVDLTLAGLIPNEARRRRDEYRNDAFTYLDSDFLPGSPAQGPFLELLNAAPEHGLNLIRRLIDHAIAARAAARKTDEDGLTLVFPSGPRCFPCARSYYWSRKSDGHYAIASGLLALEAWAHARLEGGEAPEQVIPDVLGPEGSPAAFLLVAVDLLISHWPKTMTVSIPFVGSPELLSTDRIRHAHETMPEVDLGGWAEVGSKEPAGPVRLADLTKRPSRRYGLDGLLGSFADAESADRSGLYALLAAASTRLGSPEPDDDFTDPRLMARHALNAIDPSNWREVEGGRIYVSPLAERQHIESLRERRTAHAGIIELVVLNAVEDSTKSTAELVEQAVAYAQHLSFVSEDQADFLHSRNHSIVSCAMILARDGADPLLDRHEKWARDAFAQAFISSDDTRISRLNDSIRFNPIAIATLGLIHIWRRRRHEADRDALLEVAARDNPDAAQGFGAGLAIIHGIDPRLVPALLRCALIAQIQPTHDWDDPEETKEGRRTQHRGRVAVAINAEVAWLSGGGPEPAWPMLPPPTVSLRQGIRIGGGNRVAQQAVTVRQCNQLRVQSAALWVRHLTRGSDPENASWIMSFVDAYADWTAAANGAGLEPHAEIQERCYEWNGAFFSLLARAFIRMTSDHIADHVVRATAVPDSSFFDIGSELVREIDWVHFSGSGLDVGKTLKLRRLLADRLLQTAGWRHECSKSELSVEMRIASAIAALFFNQYSSFTGASSYLLTKGIDQIDPFLPELTRLIHEGPVPFTGLLTMNLLEVSPRPTHMAFLLSSALIWLRRQPTNSPLWVHGGLGRRVAKWLETILQADPTLGSPSHPLRGQMDDVLARLVQIGVAEAHRVERLLSSSGTAASH